MKIANLISALKLPVVVLCSVCLSWAATRTVTISNFAFTDAVSNNSTTVINVGDTVQWSWSSGTHSTTSGTCSGPGACTASGTWDSTVLSAPNTFSFTFNNAGSFPYYCQVHTTSMLGKVIVKPVVTNTNDSGAGSLRQAILDVNADPDLNMITFNIPGSGVHTITPASVLPAITNPVLLDGYTQPGAAGNSLLVGDNANLVIEINGSMAGANVNGLTVVASSLISGLVINRFSGAGIVVQNNGNTTIMGNFIGTDASGAVGLGNGQSGVLFAGTSNSTLGGTFRGNRNIISGNGGYGVEMDGPAAGNHVEDNYIGTNAAGTAALPNILGGVLIGAGAGVNQIGVAGGETGNVISGNSGNGVTIRGNGNEVATNFIGVNAMGTAALGNNPNGVLVNAGASNNIIGFTDPTTRNIISGNLGAGVVVSDAFTSNNLIQGNFIGTNTAGNAAITNNDGVLVVNGADQNTIGGTNAGARNIISGNTSSGITLNGVNGSTIAGNFIGTNAAGTAAVGNSVGVFLVNANSITVGGSSGLSKNVISGNSADGIEISGGSFNSVLNNFIGVDITGNAAVPNGVGVFIAGGSHNNSIGNSNSRPSNVISGNTSYGVLLSGAGTNVNFVQGNFIGVSGLGHEPLANGGAGIALLNGPSNNTIGGVFVGAGNVISANASDGVEFTGAGTTSNLLQGNFIGPSEQQNYPLGNAANGVYVSGGAANNTIGSTTAAARNIIAYNAKGVVVTGSSTTGNAIETNAIFSNTGLGIDLNDDGVTPNTPGGPHTGPNNLQNYPVMSSAISSGGTTNVTGSLNSTPNTTFRVELFGNPACDPSGHGQGLNFLSSSNVTTDGSGNASVSFSFSTSLIGATGSVTATATDNSGNTSEFSACQQQDYPLTNVAGRNLHVRLGKAVPLVVASFTDTDPSGSAGQFSTTTIDWGDGTAPSPGTVVSTGGQNYNITGTHAYTKVGGWNVTVTINDSGGATATANSKARLWPRPLSY